MTRVSDGPAQTDLAAAAARKIERVRIPISTCGWIELPLCLQLE
jgi:hypothetical protein